MGVHDGGRTYQGLSAIGTEENKSVAAVTALLAEEHDNNGG